MSLIRHFDPILGLRVRVGLGNLAKTSGVTHERQNNGRGSKWAGKVMEGVNDMLIPGNGER